MNQSETLHKVAFSILSERFISGVIDQQTFSKAVDQLRSLTLVKGGEGSRGGKVVGHTKTGHPIYDSHGHSMKDHEDHGDGYTTKRHTVTGEGSTGHVFKHGKHIGDYEFDRDSDAFWTKHGSHDTKKDMVEAFKAKHGK